MINAVPLHCAFRLSGGMLSFSCEGTTLSELRRSEVSGVGSAQCLVLHIASGNHRGLQRGLVISDRMVHVHWSIEPQTKAILQLARGVRRGESMQVVSRYSVQLPG